MQTIKKGKIEKRADIEEELKAKKGQLKRDKARKNGGFLEEVNRNVKPIDSEIDEVATLVEMQEIQIRLDKPLAPKYEFELDDKWQELNRKGLNMMLQHNKEILNKLNAQKDEVDKRIPELEEDIKKLEEKLK